MSSLDKAKIYCIRNVIDDDVYVGHTYKTLQNRFSKHCRNVMANNYSRMKLYMKMEELGVENFYIELLEEVESDDSKEVFEAEGKHIKTIGTLNERVAGRSKKQLANERKEQNKAMKEEQKKANFEETKQKRADYKKLWARNNPEKIEHSKEKFYDKARNSEEYKSKTCECGGSISWFHKSRHLKTKRHQDYISQKINT